MKIYTEINYKWLDGQLVETDSKSFDYEGEVTHCSFGGGGGGGGGDPITSAITSAAETIDDVVKDPVGTTTDIIGDTATTFGESLEPAADIAGNVLSQTGDVVTEGLETGTSSLAMNEGVATTLGDMGANITTNMAPIVAEGSRITGKINDEIGGAMNYLGETAGHLTDFLHDPASPSAVTLDPNKFAVKGSKKKKSKSDLAVNKSKNRSRKSLRIG